MAIVYVGDLEPRAPLEQRVCPDCQADFLSYKAGPRCVLCHDDKVKTKR